MATRTLAQLVDDAGLALRYSDLVETAKSLSPTASYERALALYYGEDAAQSCRFLAMIRRDYGLDALQDAVAAKVEADLDQRFLKEVKPGIRFLESLGNGLLKIVSPEDRGLTLVSYLEQSRAYSMNLGMTLGEYQISLRWQIKKDGKYYQTESRLVITTTRGVIADQPCVRFGGETEHPSNSELRSRFYRGIMETLVNPYRFGSMQGTAMSFIRDDLEKQGMKMPPWFYSALKERGVDLHHLTRCGLVEEIVKLAAELREQAATDGVGERAMSLLNLEIWLAQREAECNQAQLDPEVPLLNKLRDKKFGVGYKVVPGPKAAKTYIFLLHLDFRADQWVQFLEKKGYGGSVVVYHINIPSGMEVAETGQCDALLLEQYGMRDKSDILDQAQESMEEVQAARGNTNVRKLPKFKYDPCYSSRNDETLGGFDKFLDEHFPLK